MTSHFELDLLRFAVSLYSGGCIPPNDLPCSLAYALYISHWIQEGFSSQLEFFLVGWGLGLRTDSILAATNFNELLDVGNFFRHRGERSGDVGDRGGRVRGRRGK